MAARGHIYLDWTEDEETPLVRRALVREGGASIVAYVGVPSGHPLAGRNYDDMPLDVHGGLTFGDEGDGKWFPAGWYWYGWDYAHLSDISRYDLKYKEADPGAHLWTVEEVEIEARDVMAQLGRMLAEEMID